MSAENQHIDVVELFFPLHFEHRFHETNGDFVANFHALIDVQEVKLLDGASCN